MIRDMAARADRTELLLLRHADAGDPEAWTRPDAERPLSPKGHRQAARTAAWLKSIDHKPDAIISSPKVRAVETARAVSEAFKMPLIEEQRLAGALDVRTVGQILNDAGNPRRPMLVGHDPDFSELAADLSGVATLEMKKGALIRIDVSTPIEPGGGVLRWLVPPDALPGEETQERRRTS
jgi:phosphohistidine phosphatase